MTAPALITLAHGSRDPRSAATIKALVAETRQMRPDLRIEPAFLELSRPDFGKVVDRLVRAGFDEIVVVPLLLSEAYHAKVDVPSAVAEATERHAGPADPDDQHPRARADLPRRARPPAARRPQRTPGCASSTPWCSPPPAPPTRSPTRPSPGWPASGAPATSCPVTAAFASAAPPATGEAVRAFRAEGRRHVAVASMFLAPGFLPDRAAELALEAGAVAVSEPLGLPTRSWPARSSPATPWVRSSSSRSEPSGPARQQREAALQDEVGRGRVVHLEAAVGEQVVGAGVGEQLGLGTSAANCLHLRQHVSPQVEQPCITLGPGRTTPEAIEGAK